MAQIGGFAASPPSTASPSCPTLLPGQFPCTASRASPIALVTVLGPLSQFVFGHRLGTRQPTVLTHLVSFDQSARAEHNDWRAKLYCGSAVGSGGSCTKCSKDCAASSNRCRPVGLFVCILMIRHSTA